MWRKIVGFSISVVSLLPVGPSAAEIVQIHPGGDLQAVDDLRQIASEGKVLHRNPHDGSVLVEVPEGAVVSLTNGGRVFRNVEAFPVSIPGSIRVLAEVEAGSAGEVDKRELAADAANAVGGREVWRSRFTRSMQFDVPVVRIGDFVEAAPLEKYWFNYHGRPSLAQSVPLIGVHGSYGPFYWPSGWGTYYIAVLDSGVLSGGALAGRVDHTLGACFSASQGGLVSDWHSTCPNEAFEAYGTTAALPCSAPGCSHGSHVAAVAVSAVAPDLGVITSPKVKILPIQVSTRYDDGIKGDVSDDYIVQYVDDVQRALDYVIQAGLVGFRVSAVNMSFSLLNPVAEGLCDGPLDALARSLDGFGVALIAAAGNVDSDGIYHALDNPACYETVIAVGATTDVTDTVAINISTPQGPYGTQSHELMNFWAPGTHITTPVEGGQVFGASFSAPHVAGVWTRLRGKYPTASNDWIEAELTTWCPKRLDSRNGVYKPRVCWTSRWK